MDPSSIKSDDDSPSPEPPDIEMKVITGDNPGSNDFDGSDEDDDYDEDGEDGSDDIKPQYNYFDDEEDEDEDEEDEELPPILEMSSFGNPRHLDENRPPPILQPFDGTGASANITVEEKHDLVETKDDDDVQIWDSDGGEHSSTTDTDDALVNVKYCTDPPKKFKQLLMKNSFVRRKDNWIYAVRSLYKKQPRRVRKLLKMHVDAGGNPIEQSTGELLERFHAERERINTARNIKAESEEADEKEEAAPVVSVKIGSSDPRLIHVAYPGNVVNTDAAVETLGGLGTVAQTFGQPSKKLHLKFRPKDPFANGINGVGRTACGLLLRIRRRKIPSDRLCAAEPSSTTANNSSMGEKFCMDLSGREPVPLGDMQDLMLDNQFIFQCTERGSTSEKSVALGGDYHCQDVLSEDKILLDSAELKEKCQKAWVSGNIKDLSLRIPAPLEAIQNPDIKVDAMGIVHRSYEFNGLCDFQYLPVMRKSDGTSISLKDTVFPILGASENPETLVCKDLIDEESACQTFILPPSMTRIDNQPKGLIEELIAADKADAAAKRVPRNDSVFSSRVRRIIYTISYNFQAENPLPEDVEVPSQPLRLAVKDIERRQIKSELVDAVRVKFDERPVWSKVALEFVTKIPALTLKYIIPYFAYFASNGPWRNTWIKFGVDPRKDPKHVIYQSVDFRVPYIYRKFMNTTEKKSETLHKFHPDHIPPKTQMFYQLCDIQLEEIKELIQTLHEKAEAETLVYDERCGYLKEGTYEYFRYILTHYLENLLQDNGKIPATTQTQVTFRIPPGEIEPTSKLKAAPHRRIKVKRIRRSAKKPSDSQAQLRTGRKVAPVKRRADTSKGTHSNSQDFLADLALNELPNDSSNDEVKDDEYMDD